MKQEFKSEDEFRDFLGEMEIIEHEAEEAGRYFDWDLEAEKYYPEFRAWRDAHCAANQAPSNTGHKISLSEYNNRELPTLPGELIGGILRKHRKLLLAGPSKAAKTGLLMELALALASGGSWLGFPCAKSKVLYIDLENDETTSVNRFFAINRSLSGTSNIPQGLDMINWRGETAPLDELKDKIIEQAQGYNVIILDPMYKVITGDENSATDMSYFCRQLDEIITETGASVIYCHHHSKGPQGQKKSMDRASGSGVFARDADALLDPGFPEHSTMKS